MLSFGEDVIGRSQKADVSDDKAGFFKDFAGRCGGEGFTVFKVAAGALEGSWAEVSCGNGGCEERENRRCWR
jgi:hypothetical protein